MLNGWQGNPPKQDVVVGHLLGWHRGDVPCERVPFLLAEVLQVGLGRVLVPLRGEHTPPADRLPAQPGPADASEQVDEPEPSLLRMWHAAAQTAQAQPDAGAVTPRTPSA